MREKDSKNVHEMEVFDGIFPRFGTLYSELNINIDTSDVRNINQPYFRTTNIFIFCMFLCVASANFFFF